MTIFLRIMFWFPLLRYANGMADQKKLTIIALSAGVLFVLFDVVEAVVYGGSFPWVFILISLVLDPFFAWLGLKSMSKIDSVLPSVFFAAILSLIVILKPVKIGEFLFSPDWWLLL